MGEQPKGVNRRRFFKAAGLAAGAGAFPAGAGLARAPATDGLFRRLDDVFGYGRPHEPEEWWDRDMPAFGVDSTRGTKR